MRFKIGGEACRHVNEYVEANGGGYRIEVAIRSCTDVHSDYHLWSFGHALVSRHSQACPLTDLRMSFVAFVSFAAAPRRVRLRRAEGD